MQHRKMRREQPQTETKPRVASSHLLLWFGFLVVAGLILHAALELRREVYATAAEPLVGSDRPGEPAVAPPVEQLTFEPPEAPAVAPDHSIVPPIAPSPSPDVPEPVVGSSTTVEYQPEIPPVEEGRIP